MKGTYPIGDDLFVIIAFSSFVVGMVSKLLGIQIVGWGISATQLINAAGFCLLFSIALSLREVAHSIRG